MKNLLLITSLFLLISLACSCDKIEEIFGNKEKPVSPHIEIDIPEINFSSDGGVNTISFNTTKEWTAHVITSRANDWCTISPTSGTVGEAMMNICTMPNEDPEDRQATIVIEAGTVSESITVLQKQKDALNITASNFEVDASGGEIEVEIETNIEFECIIEDSAADWIKLSDSWISQETTKTYQTGTIVFSIAKNTTYSNREGTIIFRAKDESISKTISIFQAQEDALIISEKEIELDEVGGTFSITIQSNVDFTVSEPDVEWLRALATRGLTDNMLYYEYDANPLYRSRNAQIVVTDIKNNKSETITITQAQTDVIILGQDHFSVESKGGIILIDISSNIDYEICLSDDWIKYLSEKSQESNRKYFGILPNTDKKDRTGIIKFVSKKDGLLSECVYINQACANGNIEGIDKGNTNDW